MQDRKRAKRGEGGKDEESSHHTVMLTIFELLEISRLDKLWLDSLKPPEEFSNEDHHIMLHREHKKHVRKTFIQTLDHHKQWLPPPYISVF